MKNQLGEGAFAKVLLAVSGENDDPYAIKIINKTEMQKRKNKVVVDPLTGAKKYVSDYEYVEKEIEIMKCLDHPNILKLHELIDDEENDNLYLVLDYAGKG
jgi:serine/threonine protein kinase